MILIRIFFLFVMTSVFSLLIVLPLSSSDFARTGKAMKEYLHYRNILPNGEMEIDDDLDNIPDGWMMHSWLPEEDNYLREAVMRYLDLEVPEVGVSIERRRAFLGERSVRLFTPSGKIGPGIWTKTALSPGLYTLNLVARSTGDDRRIVATFLAQDGKLTQVDRKWRWIHHSELIPYSTPEAVISVSDWTFHEGGVLVDHVSLVKVPFDIHYEKRIQLIPGENQYVIDIQNIPYDVLPLGANLQLQEPSGTISRKNMELDLTETESRFVFTIDAEHEGEYTVSIELYNPRTTSILFNDDRIKAYLSTNEAESSSQSDLQDPYENFFPVGISIKGYELDALKGKGMNVILLKDCHAEEVEDVISKARDMGLKVIVEINATDSSHLSTDEQSLVEHTRRSPECIGYSLLSGWGGGMDKKRSLRQVSREMKELDPERILFLRNYLPGPVDRELLGSVGGLFVDPFPITNPLKPLYTISQWIQKAKCEMDSTTRYIAMVQAFAGWPYAKQAPTLTEMRALAMLALNHGVDGIIFHTFSGDFPYFDDPVASNWDIRREQALWSGLEELVDDIKEFNHTFGKPHPVDVPLTLIPEGVLDIAYFESGNVVYANVVNVTPVSIGIRGISPSYHESDTIGIIPKETMIKCGEGFFEDNLPPFGVRMYSLRSLFPGGFPAETSNNEH